MATGGPSSSDPTSQTPGQSNTGGGEYDFGYSHVGSPQVDPNMLEEIRKLSFEAAAISEAKMHQDLEEKLAPIQQQLALLLAAISSLSGAPVKSTPPDPSLSLPPPLQSHAAPSGVGNSGPSATSLGGVAGHAPQQVVVQVERPSFYRIKTFSGMKPPRNGESTFMEWIKQAYLLLEDDTLSAVGKRQKILSSLQSAAFDMALTLGKDNTAEEIIDHLKTVYQDRDSVTTMREFYKLAPDTSERPSEYLIRLELELHNILSRGGISEDGINKARLDQFRVTNVDPFVTNLLNARFPQDSVQPSMRDLITAVKSVETADPPSKPGKVKSQAHSVVSDASRMDAVEEKISALLAQVNIAHKDIKRERKSSNPKDTRRNQGNSRDTRRNLSRFCYHCGDYSHLRRNCRNPRNNDAVSARMNALADEREKRQSDLNFNGSQ